MTLVRASKTAVYLNTPQRQSYVFDTYFPELSQRGPASRTAVVSGLDLYHLINCVWYRFCFYYAYSSVSVYNVRATVVA
jgi:hypothetical protein